MAINSRQKGKRIELEACKFLASIGFPGVQRTAQHCGKNGDAPDIRGLSLQGVHIEVKGDQKIDLGTQAISDALVQAKKDADGKPYGVLWKRNRTSWRLTTESMDGRRTCDTEHGIYTAIRQLQSDAIFTP